MTKPPESEFMIMMMMMMMVRCRNQVLLFACLVLSRFHRLPCKRMEYLSCRSLSRGSSRSTSKRAWCRSGITRAFAQGDMLIASTLTLTTLLSSTFSFTQSLTYYSHRSIHSLECMRNQNFTVTVTVNVKSEIVTKKRVCAICYVDRKISP